MFGNIKRTVMFFLLFIVVLTNAASEETSLEKVRRLNKALADSDPKDADATCKVKQEDIEKITKDESAAYEKLKTGAEEGSGNYNPQLEAIFKNVHNTLRETIAESRINLKNIDTMKGSEDGDYGVVSKQLEELIRTHGEKIELLNKDQEALKTELQGSREQMATSIKNATGSIKKFEKWEESIPALERKLVKYRTALEAEKKRHNASLATADARVETYKFLARKFSAEVRTFEEAKKALKRSHDEYKSDCERKEVRLKGVSVRPIDDLVIEAETALKLHLAIGVFIPKITEKVENDVISLGSIKDLNLLDAEHPKKVELLFATVVNHIKTVKLLNADTIVDEHTKYTKPGEEALDEAYALAIAKLDVGTFTFKPKDYTRDMKGDLDDTGDKMKADLEELDEEEEAENRRNAKQLKDYNKMMYALDWMTEKYKESQRSTESSIEGCEGLDGSIQLRYNEVLEEINVNSGAHEGKQTDLKAKQKAKITYVNGWGEKPAKVPFVAKGLLLIKTWFDPQNDDLKSKLAKIQPAKTTLGDQVALANECVAKQRDEYTKNGDATDRILNGVKEDLKAAIEAENHRHRLELGSITARRQKIEDGNPELYKEIMAKRNADASNANDAAAGGVVSESIVSMEENENPVELTWDAVTSMEWGPGLDKCEAAVGDVKAAITSLQTNASTATGASEMMENPDISDVSGITGFEKLGTDLENEKSNGETADDLGEALEKLKEEAATNGEKRNAYKLLINKLRELRKTIRTEKKDKSKPENLTKLKNAFRTKYKRTHTRLQAVLKYGPPKAEIVAEAIGVADAKGDATVAKPPAQEDDFSRLHREHESKVQKNHTILVGALDSLITKINQEISDAQTFLTEMKDVLTRTTSEVGKDHSGKEEASFDSDQPIAE